jgi:hypothetical protein
MIGQNAVPPAVKIGTTRFIAIQLLCQRARAARGLQCSSVCFSAHVLAISSTDLGTSWWEMSIFIGHIQLEWNCEYEF